MRYRIMLSCTLLWLLPALAGDPAPAAHPATRVVVDFNAAVTGRDMDAAMGLLADGSVQFQLRSAHPEMGGNPALTEDMASTWKLVSAILFPATEAYERRVVITDVHADGALATVWTDTRTVTHRAGSEAPTVREFSEMYLLIRRETGEWRIAAAATNRPPAPVTDGA